MKFERMISLHEITIIKVTTTLWNHTNGCRIKLSEKKLRHPAFSRTGSSRNRKFARMEDEVKLKISELEVPESLKQRVTDFVKPIGREIFKWCEYHCLDGYLNLPPPNEFCWTTRGTIDLKKTAEGLVRDEKLCLIARYKLACIYCLEESITRLWHKMCERCKAQFYQKQFFMHHQLVKFWTSFNRGEMARLEISSRKNLYQFVFESAVVRRNIVATKYFWEKLTPEEKERSLMVSAGSLMLICESSSHQRHYFDFPVQYCSEIVFLLSQSETLQQIEIFRCHTLAVLKCFVQWPFHRVLRETASTILDYTSDRDYFTFFEIIINADLEGHSYYNFSELFTELWQKSTLTRNKYVVSVSKVSSLIGMLLRTKDALKLKLILDEMDTVKKKDYLCSLTGQFQCCELIGRNDCDLMRMLIQQCLQQREDFEEFNKNVIAGSGCHKYHVHLVRLSHELIRQQCKRKNMEDYYSNPSKKYTAGKTKEAQVMEAFKRWRNQY